MSTGATFQKMSPQLLVTDLDQAIAYYITKLGFEVEFRHEDFYAGIIKDGFSIHLKSGSPNMEERKNKRARHDLDIVFAVADVQALYDEMLLKEIDIVQPLCDRPYGTEFYIADPDGYILAFLQ